MSRAKFRTVGTFIIACYAPDGTLKWREKATNGVTTVGLNHVLDVAFHASTQSTVWLVGLIRDDNFTGLAAADTMAVHGGWEEADEYDEATRPIWTEGASAAGVITNAVTVDFTMNAVETIKGAFLVDDNEIGGVAGTLFCTALFDGGDQVVADDDVLQATYTITGSDET